jgi:hypothetical protein
MKIRFVVIVLILLISTQVFPSTLHKPFRVGISMGSVIPIKEFISTDLNSVNSGFSLPGVALNFDGDYYLHNRFALSGRLYFGMSSINEKENINQIKSFLGDYFSEDLSSSFIGYWRWSAPMLGAKYNFPLIINKLYIETGLFSGLSITPVPTQFMKIIDSENKRDIFSHNLSKNSYSMPLMTDLALRIIFNDSMQMKVQASYFQTGTNHTHLTYYVNENSPTVIEEISTKDFTIPIKVLNFTIGLIYIL